MAKNIKTGQKKINPNKSKNAVFSADLSKEKYYPRFIEQIKFDNFRHIKDLSIQFRTPVTIISGANRSGKTTVLLAIACSHFEFNKRNYSNGKLERQTWSDIIKFTAHDQQNTDWTYHLKIKSGAKIEERRGQRKSDTKKWNGLGKKESQIKDVSVVYLDLDRILPARYFSSVLHFKAKYAAAGNVSGVNQKFIEDCFSYIFEDSYSLIKLANHHDKDLLGYTNDNKYSSYNSASGEDVLSRILIDCIDAPENSLILIDEIELGLHPGIQRRLMDIIFEISTRDQKQFIITSHSGTILSSVPEHARVFIDNKNGEHQSINPISINAAFSKMDSKNYPLVEIFCEDPVAEKILTKALQEIEAKNISGISANIFKIIKSGTADNTFTNFTVRDRIYKDVDIKSGHCCVLDGDMRDKKDKEGNNIYPAQVGLFFLPGTVPPEKLLCAKYVAKHKNQKMNYHIANSDVHCLFDKMIEAGVFTNKDQLFEECWKVCLDDAVLNEEFNSLIGFLIAECRRYSPDL